MSNSEIRSKELQKSIQRAFKLWYKPNTDTSPLSHLKIFQKILMEDSTNMRDATNRLLLDALNILEATHKLQAKLLRQHYLDEEIVHKVANNLNVSETTFYRKQKEAIKQLATIIYKQEIATRKKLRTLLEERLEPPTYTELIGVDEHISALKTLLTATNEHWIISIEGLGGIGKTSLAHAVSNLIIEHNLFDNFGWVSAKRYILNLNNLHTNLVTLPALSVADLIRRLVVQLTANLFETTILSDQEAITILRRRFKKIPHLIVIDNLETITDIENLLPVLRSLANPTKFLLTSRKNLYGEAGIYHFNLEELDLTYTLQLLRHLGHSHNLPHLTKAHESELTKIFNSVGGNPLAIKLIVGQMHIHSLDTILETLTHIHTTKTEALYAYIYRYAWDNLKDLTRRIFLAMPLVTDHEDCLARLIDITGFDKVTLCDGLDKLVALNLVDSKGDLQQRYYTIHNLTRTFLEEQIATWS